MLRKLRSQKGFTLIELMVVILIIGILVAIAVPVFNAARENAYRRTCQANLRTIDGAVQTFRASSDTGLWPTTIANLVSGGFLKTAPQCPKAANGYGMYSDATMTAAPTADQSTAPVVACPGYAADHSATSPYLLHTY